MTANAQYWIRRLDLSPHPEGGFYRETYRSSLGVSATLVGGKAGGRRSLSTAIYFLLLRGQTSRIHRIGSDELWHHYAGGVIVIHMLMPDGVYCRQRLGRDVQRQEQPQVVVPAGTWFGATLTPRVPFALAGCTVAPGFDFSDFELGDAEKLSALYPGHAPLIRRLTAGQDKSSVA